MRRVEWTMRLAGCSGLIIIYCFFAGGAILMPGQRAAADAPQVEENGTIHVPASPF